MKTTFLCQAPFHAESIGKILIDSLSDTDFDKFGCLVAYAGLSGVTGLIEILRKSKQHFKQCRAIIGINQRLTSKEALEALLSSGIQTSIYYTFSPITFHPKMYLFEGEKRNRIIVGSSNLTRQGLFQNVEMAVQIDITRPDPEGEALLKQTNEYLTRFFEGKIENVKPLTTDLINRLHEMKLIPDETEKQKEKEQRINARKDKQEKAKMDELQKLFPPVEIQKSPDSFKATETIRRVQPHKVTEKVVIATPALMLPPPQDPWATKGKLLWRKQLTRRDLQIVSTRTAPTGVISLTQADFKTKGQVIDQTTYFKDEIFRGFIWKTDRPSSKAVTTKVKFMVKIMGKDLGQHELTLRHNPKWEANQANYTTGISWGVLTRSVKNPALINKTFYLYAPTNGQKEPFFIEIA